MRSLVAQISLQDLMHIDLDPIRMPFSDADEKRLHQPTILFAPGFKSRDRTKVNQLLIDWLSTFDFLKSFPWAETYSGILDIDDRAVIGLKRILGFDFREPVWANKLKIGAARQYFAAYTSPPSIGMRRRVV